MNTREKKVVNEFREEIIQLICKWIPHSVDSTKKHLNERFDSFEEKLKMK